MKSAINLLIAPNKLRLWLLVFLMGLASLASYWVLELIRSQPNGGSKANARAQPDYFIENFNYIKMLPDGQGKYRLVGAKLTHYPSDDHADDHAEIALPVITSLDPTQPRTTLHSERAVVKNLAHRAETEVAFYDNVVLNRPQTAKTEHIQLTTDYLLAYPDKNTAQTNLPVEIIAGSTVTTGVGMTANNTTQEMEILSNVYSIIPPQTKQKK
jgi:lipopolysaccharide export system protein LptC